MVWPLTQLVKWEKFGVHLEYSSLMTDSFAWLKWYTWSTMRVWSHGSSARPIDDFDLAHSRTETCSILIFAAVGFPNTITMRWSCMTPPQYKRVRLDVKTNTFLDCQPTYYSRVIKQPLWGMPTLCRAVLSYWLNHEKHINGSDVLKLKYISPS